MGAGYYPLDGVLARQLREREMWDYEPDQHKKQPAIPIILHRLFTSTSGGVAPALWRQGLLGTKGLLIRRSGTVFTLAAHPEVIARDTAIQLKKTLSTITRMLDDMSGIFQQPLIGTAPHVDSALRKLLARIGTTARNAYMTGDARLRPAQTVNKHLGGIGQYLYLERLGHFSFDITSPSGATPSNHAHQQREDNNLAHLSAL